MTDTEPALIVHGGAGRIDEARTGACLEACRHAARRGWQVLAEGGAALDAVEAATVALEDDPALNAGRGAVLNAAGEAELDASIMAGADRRAGAVGALRRVRNPVRLARAILEDGRHVMLVGAGAERFARGAGLPLCRNRALITPAARERWEVSHGTVGCVARDGCGRLAAATSTGGRAGDLPGRIGDSALIGSGTWADARAAVSCTGIGEDIIRVLLARAAAERIVAGASPADAAGGALDELVEGTGSEAGLIMLGATGGPVWRHNAEHMPVAWIDASGEPVTRV